MSLVQEAHELEAEFKALFEELPLRYAYGTSGFTHPSWPVIPAEDSERAHMLRWGLIPFWVKDRTQADGLRKKTLNARMETAWRLPSFRAAMPSRRCIVAADGFYEPHRYEGKSYPFYVCRRDRRPFGIGGLYDRWRDPVSGRTFAAFSVLTLPAEGILARVHNGKRRMPALIPQHAYRRWLDRDLAAGEVADIPREFPLDELTAHPVGPQLYARSGRTEGEYLRKPHQYGLPAIDELISS